MFTKTLLFGVGGIIVGGLHNVTGGVSNTKTDLKLCTPFHHIQQDGTLLGVLHVIDEEFKEVDHVAAVRAILAIDRLVGLRNELQQHLHEPIMADRVEGMLCYKKAKHAIQRFISRAEATKTPRRVIYLQRHVQTIMRQLDLHLQSIVLSTRDMYMYP
jgi:hypothetical protein